MRDVVFLLIVTSFFGLCVAYVQLCDRVIGPDPQSPMTDAGAVPDAHGERS